jgi:hypothetical protein
LLLKYSDPRSIDGASLRVCTAGRGKGGKTLYPDTLRCREDCSSLPQIGDSVAYEPPAFEYSIISKRFETDYRVTPINPARMVKPELDKLYKSELKLGGGNYLTPLAELEDQPGEIQQRYVWSVAETPLDERADEAG